MPKVVQDLAPAIVTVTRVDAKTGQPAPSRNGHAGLVIDSRGFIVTPLVDDRDGAMPFKVRLADAVEFIAEVVAKDEDLNLMMLRIKNPQPLLAISLAKICEPQQGDLIYLVTSPATKGSISGRVTATSVDLGETDPIKVIQTDIKLPLSEGGGLMVSALGEPIGISCGIREGEPPATFVRPLNAILSFIKSATTAGAPSELIATDPLVQTVVTETRIDLKKTIVRVTEIDATTRLPIPERSDFSGVRMGRDGLIVTLMTGTEDEELKKHFKVRFADRSEHVAEILNREPQLRLTVLNVPGDRGSPAVSLTKIRKVKQGDVVHSVPSFPSTPVLKGRVTGVNVAMGPEFPKNLIRTDIVLPLGERGGLLVSEDGDPVGIWCAPQDGEQQASFAIPLDDISQLVDFNRYVADAGEKTITAKEMSAPKSSKEGPSSALLGDENRIPEIVGTWTRAESGTFSNLTIWPVENREFLFFVEGADGNGLLEWKPANFNFQGFFTFNLLGDWTAQASLVVHGPKETRRLIISPFEGQRKQLLRSDFAKTERELDQKLSSDWTRVEAPTQSPPIPTATVVKTEIGPARVREFLRAKYRGQPYRFFSNDTFRSVIVLAPAEAQDDIEVLIHKLDIKEESDDEAASPNIAQQSPAIQPTDETKFFHLRSCDATATLGVVEKLFQGRVRRISADQRTNSLIVVAEPDVCIEVEAVVLKLESTPTQQGPAEANRSSPIPDTRATKQLVEQLGAQESAAVAEAAKIRQLQANGLAEQNKQSIAEHQRKLKNLLSTAFDLKLQLEELQLKELQSRLSRLERLIGQRKGLRAKIIDRRASELVQGEATQWNALEAVRSSSAPSKPVGDNNHRNADSSPAVAKQLHERVDLLRKELPNGKVKPGDVLNALNDLSQVAPFGQIEWRLHDLMQFAEQSRGPGVISPAEYLEIVAAHEKSRGAGPSITRGGLEDKAENASVIVVDLYGGPKVLAEISKNAQYTKLLQTLNALPGVQTNFREVQIEDPLIIVSATVSDPAQRFVREPQQTQDGTTLRASISTALEAAGIKAVRWEAGAPRASNVSTDSPREGQFKARLNQ